MLKYVRLHLSVFVSVVIKIHCQIVRIIVVVSIVETSQWVSIPLSAGKTILLGFYCLGTTLRHSPTFSWREIFDEFHRLDF